MAQLGMAERLPTCWPAHHPKVRTVLGASPLPGLRFPTSQSSRAPPAAVQPHSPVFCRPLNVSGGPLRTRQPRERRPEGPVLVPQPAPSRSPPAPASRPSGTGRARQQRGSLRLRYFVCTQERVKGKQRCQGCRRAAVGTGLAVQGRPPWFWTLASGPPLSFPDTKLLLDPPTTLWAHLSFLLRPEPSAPGGTLTRGPRCRTALGSGHGDRGLASHSQGPARGQPGGQTVAQGPRVRSRPLAH